MLVRYFMTTEVHCLRQEMRCIDALRLFEAQRIRRAPVVEAGRIVGILSDRDLFRVLPWKRDKIWELEDAEPCEALVGEVMSKNLISVSPQDHLEDVARLMMKHKIGALPVLEARKLVGFLTETDIFRVFVQLSDQTRALRVTFQASGAGDPVAICIAEGRNLKRLTCYTSPAGTTLYTVQVAGLHARQLPARLREAGHRVLDSTQLRG